VLSSSVRPAVSSFGVLALQGAFARHIDALGACGVAAREIRTAEQLATVDALVIPGGESTTISKLLVSQGLVEPLRRRLAAGMPVFGTCAGMILLSNEILDGRPDQLSFGRIDLAVRRNGYGRQIASFETDLDVAGLDGTFRAVFIRAPKVERIGPGVDVLAEVDGVPVLCRSGSVVVASFHPELTDDPRLHQLFIETVASA
jgi:5'-phosphate synthase pdxT subunit